ncbi:MAG: NADH:ubiquinone reductase (Na(+)-transporting) subunit E, partial [Desulfobacteraceae bacterium]
VMENLISLFVNSVFVGNILLAYFLGMCSYLSVSKNLQTSFGLGLAVTFVLAITTPANWLVYKFLLAPGALAWAGLPQVDLSYLKLVLFIAVIAGMVQVVEMVIDRYSQGLYNALGVFLPLITVNCAILGASLFMVERRYTFAESVVFGIGSGIGWLLAIVSMATIMQKLRYADVPKGLEGFGIRMIVTGLMAMAFMLFSGITL